MKKTVVSFALVCALSVTISAQAGIFTSLIVGAAARHQMKKVEEKQFDAMPKRTLPDPRKTPGATNPDVTQENIHETICRRNYRGTSYSKSIRPPVEYTQQLKGELLREYGYGGTSTKHFELDHLVAISIGGAPRDRANMWPEPWTGEWSAVQKDQLEFVLYKMVCNEEIRLRVAQQAMAVNWISAWHKYVPSHPNYVFKKKSNVVDID